jgi:hypothetical protein
MKQVICNPCWAYHRLYIRTIFWEYIHKNKGFKMRPSTSFYLLAFSVNQRQKFKNGLYETSKFAILAEHTTGFTYARYFRKTYIKFRLQNETRYVFVSPRLLCKSASEVEQTVNMKQVNLQSLLSVPQALHTHDILGVHTWKQRLQNETKYVFVSPRLLCKSASEVEERFL